MTAAPKPNSWVLGLRIIWRRCSLQVYEVLTTMLKYTNDLVTVSHTANLQGSAGGPSGGPLFAPPTVMVATPTGMLQYLDQLRRQERRMDLQLSLQVLIVDEADLLFAFGFEKDTRRLLQLLPSTASRHYQTILVSATQNQEVRQPHRPESSPVVWFSTGTVFGLRFHGYGIGSGGIEIREQA